MADFIKDAPIKFHTGTFITLLIAVIWGVGSLLAVYYTLNNKVEKNAVYNEHNSRIWAELDERVSKLENNAVQMTTDLAWIKTTLLEIKQVLISN